MDILLNGVDTGMDATMQQGNPGVSSPTFLTNSVVPFTVANDNDTVTIRYAFGSGGTNFGLNGFDLESLAGPVVPEPSTLVLCGLSLISLGLVGWRRRRR